MSPTTLMWRWAECLHALPMLILNVWLNCFACSTASSFCFIPCCFVDCSPGSSCGTVGLLLHCNLSKRFVCCIAAFYGNVKVPAGVHPDTMCCVGMTVSMQWRQSQRVVCTPLPLWDSSPRDDAGQAPPCMTMVWPASTVPTTCKLWRQPAMRGHVPRRLVLMSHHISYT